MAISPMTLTDPFQVLGLPRRFDLAPGVIEKAMLVRSATAHPDRGGSESDLAAVQEAHEVVASPESRAVALLKLLGGNNPRDRALPEGFLSEMMSLRLEMEEDLKDDRTLAFARWMAWAQSQQAEIVESIRQSFEEAHSAEPTSRDHAFAAIRTSINQLRYINRMIEQLDPGAAGPDGTR